MPIAYDLNRYSAFLTGRSSVSSLPRSKPGKEEGLLISPTSGQGSEVSAPYSRAHVWLGIGLILSVFNLVFALFSLILF